MPLVPGEETGKAISELHSGHTYSRTRRKYGKKKANAQAIAIAIKNHRKGKKHRRKSKRSRKMARR